MAFISRRALLETVTPVFQCKRFRGKINVQKPKPPHFVKATYLSLAKPWFINPKKDKAPIELCNLLNHKYDKHEEEENMYAKLLGRELYKDFANSKMILFYHHNSIKSDEFYKYFALFKRQNMDLKKIGKQVLTLAVTGTRFEPVLDFYLTANNMILFSPEPAIDTVLKINKKCPRLVLLTGIYENQLLSKDDLEKYSKIPNIQAAQAELVQTMNALGSKLVTDLNAHQTNLVGNLESRIKQLEEE
ncbi:unnamed protein product [Phyllotreta striolata]|uniref:Large ribosomal subunit protein uL10m n=1 Tax=Phyllotreta striolata TaxID=444603 RepID=A0A9N9XX00_PHYSR|nr:unnamed protein product [Phyllotreta striolata]